jgi:uncharacterized protein YegL
MAKQERFGEGRPTITNPNEPHMACLLLLDTSISMSGDSINSLNKGVNTFKREVIKDEKTCRVLDVAIVEFNSSHSPVQPFDSIVNMQDVNLLAIGESTVMTPAIEEAMQMVDERSDEYYRWTEPYKPWIVMITDGAPTDNIDAVAQKIHRWEEAGKGRFWVLGVGKYDPVVSRKLAGERALKLTGYDFSKFFDWLNKSMRVKSNTPKGQKVQGVNLPVDVDKDTTDLIND